MFLFIKVYPNKYSSLVVRERGLVLLNELINHPTPNAKIKGLAQIVVDIAFKTVHVSGFTTLDG